MDHPADGRRVALAFEQVILRVAVHDLRHDPGIGSTGEHDDRHLGGGSHQRVDRAQPLGVGERQIGQYGVETMLAEQRFGLARGRRDRRRVLPRIIEIQDTLQEQGITRIVFNQQEADGHNALLQSFVVGGGPTLSGLVLTYISVP